MEQGNKSLGQSEVKPLAKSQKEAQELAREAGLPYARLRDDGAIVFGPDCLTLKPTPEGPLKLTIRPSQCGQVQGEVLLDHLLKTAGKGVLIEIPSVEDQE